jgi:membrane fusion protein (multidrug efflux system)
MSEAAGPSVPSPGTQNPPKPGLSPRKRAVYLVLAAVLVVGGAAVGIWYYLYAQAHEWTDDAFIAADVTAVSSRVPGRVVTVNFRENQKVAKGDVLVEIDPRDFEVRLAQARAGLSAAQHQEKTARTNVGLVKSVTAATIDQAQGGVGQAEAGLAMAKAGVDAARAKLAQADAGIAASKATAEAAKATVAAAEADAVRTAGDLKRYEELVAAKRISPQQFDAATAAARAAAAKLDAARKGAAAAEAGIAASEAERQAAAEGLKVAEAQVGQTLAKIVQEKGRLAEAQSAPDRIAVAESQLLTAEAEVKRLQALVDQAELELSYTRVLAPESGRLARKVVEPGAMFQAGQAMVSLVSENVWVVANFKETALDHIRPGQSATIAVDAYPGVVFHGHVDSIQSGTGAQFSLLPPENATGNYVKIVQRVPVKILLDDPPDPEHLLAPGMSVIPEVELKTPGAEARK